MILSMTGFGEGHAEEDSHAYQLEIRSVNNRYFKAAVRLPDEFAYMETQLEGLLRKTLVRGSITLRLFTRDLSAAAAQDLNIAAVKHYVRQFDDIESGEHSLAIDLATLATLPGVCQPRDLSERDRQQGEKLVRNLAEGALRDLLAMRESEGRSIAGDLKQHCGAVAEHVEAIQQYVPSMVESYRDRLKARVEELLADSNVHLAQEDLLKEVSVYAERSDVNEELSRLASHLGQFREALESQEAAGRKLDFIAQEMLREANTIGSKAGDAEVARHVIEVKGAIDRIKEQVQNVV